jgi:hypothetical protein
MSQGEAECPDALGSEAKWNGDGRAQYYFLRSHRVPFRSFIISAFELNAG